MDDSFQQIAEDLHRLYKEMEALSARIADSGFERDDVRSKLGDYSTVISGLRHRVMALGECQFLQENNHEH
jgi:CII-binding regulator of phage lambda lysogenization HflD